MVHMHNISGKQENAGKKLYSAVTQKYNKIFLSKLYLDRKHKFVAFMTMSCFGYFYEN